jgi:hypothetical protein
MRLNIYRRAEPNGRFSYLAVPENRSIPDEAANTDWEVAALAHDTGADETRLPEYAIDRLTEQIAEKGYAVTALSEQA